MKRSIWRIAFPALLLAGLLPSAMPQTPSPGPKIGDPAPKLELETVLPPSRALNWPALRSQVVVLEFWATWCAPCVAQIPHLNALAKKFENRPLQIISITDEDKEQVARFLAKRPIAGWVALNPSRSMFRAYGVGGIPHTVLVDKKGIVAAVTYPEQVTEAVLEDMLAGKPPKVSARPTSPPVTVRRETEGTSPAPLVDVLVRPAQSANNSMRSGKGRWEARGETLLLALANAYHIALSRIVAPAWAAEAKYDVLVAVPNGSNSDVEPLFRQTLEAAFRLKVRRERQTKDVLVMTAPQGRSKNLFTPATSGSMSSSNLGEIKAINCSLNSLVSVLESKLKQLVVDETGLPERYDYELRWDPSAPGSLRRALREQLGLELTPAQRPVEMLIVESAWVDPPK